MELLKTPLFVALDVDSDVAALKIAKDVADYVGGFKLGPRLLLRYGGEFAKKIADLGIVFIDQKYHDIPSTMAAAVQASFDVGASFVTIHAAAGVEGMREVVQLEQRLRQQRPFQVLAVTVLTSLAEESKPSNWKSSFDLNAHVKALAQDAASAGVSGLVCSPYEVQSLRRDHPQSFLLTPGIRQLSASDDDQTRISGPREALLKGSSALVVGRPIIAAPNPRQAAQSFFDAIQGLHLEAP